MGLILDLQAEWDGYFQECIRPLQIRVKTAQWLGIASLGVALLSMFGADSISVGFFGGLLSIVLAGVAQVLHVQVIDGVPQWKAYNENSQVCLRDLLRRVDGNLPFILYLRSFDTEYSNDLNGFDFDGLAFLYITPRHDCTVETFIFESIPKAIPVFGPASPTCSVVDGYKQIYCRTESWFKLLSEIAPKACLIILHISQELDGRFPTGLFREVDYLASIDGLNNIWLIYKHGTERHDSVVSLRSRTGLVTAYDSTEPFSLHGCRVRRYFLDASVSGDLSGVMERALHHGHPQ